MMHLSEAARATHGQLVGQDGVFEGVTTDSRKVSAGDLFVALRGDRFDGHDFVSQCFSQGAVGALVWDGSNIAADGALIRVDDTRTALGTLAAYWRGKFDIPLAAVTGSNGKTTVKEMLAGILRVASSEREVLATEGNLNNDIGLPLTLLKLRQGHRFAVAEMGMNHTGEIAYLTRMAQPSVTLINNAQPAHLEGLGSVEAVARAKGEIFQGLGAGGTAVFNADDAYAPLWAELASKHRILTFGLTHSADVVATYAPEQSGSQIRLITPQGECEVRLSVAGEHNVRNALAASTAALAMGVPMAAIVAGLEQFGGVKGRLQHKPGYRGALVIDDTYNANPASMWAAISVLSRMPGQRIFVMGDMGELGGSSKQLHAEIGAEASAAGIDRLYALGELSRHAVAAFGAKACHFETPEALGQAVREVMGPACTVLVKGSRFMRMEQIVDLLIEKEKVACC